MILSESKFGVEFNFSADYCFSMYGLIINIFVLRVFLVLIISFIELYKNKEGSLRFIQINEASRRKYQDSLCSFLFNINLSLNFKLFRS